MPPTCHGYCLVLVPVLIGVFGPVMLVTCYTIAVLHGDVSKLFPYISDTGGDPPESCIFGQLLNMIAFFVFAGVLLRYKQVSSMILPLSINRVSGLSVLAGCLAALGASLVANFQDTTVVMVHYTGALLLFLFGIIYCLCQTYISYHINVHINRKWICHLRMVLSVIAAVSMITCIIGSNIAEKRWNEHHVSPSIFKWGPKDGGYPAHLVSTFSEWAMSIALIGYFVTFIPDFLNLSVILELQFFQSA